MKWLWCPLFLIFAMIEFVKDAPVCSSGYVTSTMWFMWLMMGLMTSKIYIEKVLNGNN